MSQTYAAARERLAANYYLAPPEVSVGQFMQWARDAGARGVGLTVAALAAHDARELKSMAADNGLFISTLNSAGYFLLSEFDQRYVQDKLNCRLVEAAAEMGAGRLVAVAGGISGSGLNLEQGRAKVAQSLTSLDRAAGKAGIRLALEPIHPVDLTIKGCVNSVAQALAVIKALPHTDVIVDLFHSYWDDDIWRLNEIGGDRIAAVQVCNWREPHPDAKPVRDLPSAGPMDVAGWLRVLIDGGFTGPIEFEMFDRHRSGCAVPDILNQAFKELNAILS
jgi:sugar phosphate isomerase/epimerase